MSLHIVEEQMNYETRMWFQVVTQLKLVIPAPDAVLVGVKLWPREKGVAYIEDGNFPVQIPTPLVPIERPSNESLSREEGWSIDDKV